VVRDSTIGTILNVGQELECLLHPSVCGVLLLFNLSTNDIIERSWCYFKVSLNGTKLEVL